MRDLQRYRVWPDGTVQDIEDDPYHWMSDDYQTVSATNEDEAREIVLERGQQCVSPTSSGTWCAA